ncbi:MAG: DUF1294 domain-containing protein [Oscillospiraceae bacterium]|nr:DUF1294 domain-containing protein [Oscillospiraceae bacterium]
MIIYLVAINITALIVMAADKKHAVKKQRRVPESVLLTLAFIGGSVGALLGMFICRHKTRHLKFTILFPLFLILHIAIALLLADLI